MVRVTVSVNDSTLSKVDAEANNRGISRSEMVAKAIDSFVEDVKQGYAEVHNLELELNKSQTEVMQLKRQITKLENQLTEKDKVIDSNARDVTQLDEKVNQSYADVMQARAEIAKFESALNAKNDELTFLRGHLSQLTEKIQARLPPSQEEAKKKGWWQFWK